MVTNPNTGQKSTSRVAYFTTIVLAALLIVSCIVVMIVDVFKEGKVQTDYFEGISKIVLAASALIFCSALPKSMSDKWQNKNKNNDYEVNK
jgi:hypothetical protein